jgi:hypothetical protein
MDCSRPARSLGFVFARSFVTLSACDTGSGSEHGQDGVSSLVRPFFAAGARSVVANLWAADDSFSLTLMREFYRRLAAGDDVGQALRVAKLRDDREVRSAGHGATVERRGRLRRCDGVDRRDGEHEQIRTGT